MEGDFFMENTDNVVYYIQTKEFLIKDEDDEAGRRTRTSSASEKEMIQKLGQKSKEMIGKVIADVSDTMLFQIENMEKKPSECEIEFGVNVSSEGKICIVSGGITSLLKVKMLWKNEKNL